MTTTPTVQQPSRVVTGWVLHPEDGTRGWESDLADSNRRLRHGKAMSYPYTKIACGCPESNRALLGGSQPCYRNTSTT
jgi:hypothetical protein